MTSQSTRTLRGGLLVKILAIVKLVHMLRLMKSKLPSKNKKCCILGGGISGNSARKLLKTLGYRIDLYDKNYKESGIDYDGAFPDHSLTDGKDYDFLIKSPGVNPGHPILAEAKSKPIPVFSEIELGSFFFQGKMIAITGTDGKSTTTALTAHLITSGFPKTRAGGNLGEPFTSFCLEDLDFAVLELSSYQLEDSPILNPFAGAFLNLAEDHLERHSSMENYLAAKKKIIPTSKSHFFILNDRFKQVIDSDTLDCHLLTFGKDKTCDAIISSDGSELMMKGHSYNLKNFTLKGAHNSENAATAVLLAECCKVPEDLIQKSLESFQGLPYRFRFSGIKNGATVINDSKSTNLHSMASGLSGIPLQEKIFLFLGGRPKKEGLDVLFKNIRNRQVWIFLFGEAKEIWGKELLENSPNVFAFANLDGAFAKMTQEAERIHPEWILFSPACASFDQYKNFEERGRHFDRLVEEWSRH